MKTPKVNHKSVAPSSAATLILTGWGWKDYAVAAALALRHHKTAAVLGMSTRRLPEFLATVSGYGEIVILGIGLRGDPELLEKSLKKLAGQGVKLSWISACQFPDGLPAAIRENLAVWVEASGSLTDAVAATYGLDATDLKPMIDEKPRSVICREYHQLLEAAMFYYRNYQDTDAYPSAIAHMSRKDSVGSWSAAENLMVDHYKRHGNRELVGKSPAMLTLIERIKLVAAKDRARVLIFGESGTGKETVALQIHNKSPRRSEAFIAFNCASVTPNLLESRFLGYEKGAFTGASELKKGVFEQADKGTLFLDEIGEMPLEAQGLLLRVLEGGRFFRMGDKTEVVVDVRLITATNCDLPAMVRAGKFREDLFHRLNVVQLRIPPLRQHKEDIRGIAEAYWLNNHRCHLSPKQLEALGNYDYPGNVRELFNLLERASVLDETDFAKLLAEHQENNAGLIAPAESTDPDNLEEMTRRHVRRVYEKHGGNLTATAKALGVVRNTASKYLK